MKNRKSVKAIGKLLRSDRKAGKNAVVVVKSRPSGAGADSASTLKIQSEELTPPNPPSPVPILSPPSPEFGWPINAVQ